MGSDLRATSTNVIVGANGFIGSHFSHFLDALHAAHLRVTRSKPLLDVAGNLSLEVQTIQVKTLYWLASSSVPATVEQDPTLIHREVSYFVHCLKELRRYQPELRVVLVSSASVVYAADTQPCLEDAELKPFNQYGHLKAALEDALKSSALDYMILRVTNAYGPGQKYGRGQGVIAEWLRAAREQKPMIIFGGENTSRDYVHVTDVVRAMSLVESRWLSREVVNIGSGESVSLGNLLEIVKSIVGENIVIEHRESRAVDRPSVAISIAKATTRLGWAPQVDLRKGIQSWWELMNA
jgi:UDP-glucose 4-epimerase